MLDGEIMQRFTYHAPKGDQPARYEKMREQARELAFVINDLVPECREKALAITKLEECVMWANAGIARHRTDA